jgi:hypothetical protein
MTALAATASLALGACAGSSQRNASTTMPALRDQATYASGAKQEAASGSASRVVELTRAKRPDGAAVIHTSEVTIQAKDVDRALRKATDLVRVAGGDVFSANGDFADRREVHVVFKVPPASFDQVMSELASVGKITHSTTSTSDVTGQVVDLDARLAAARASVDRVRELLAKSGGVSDLLTVEQALTEREANVESLAAQAAALHAQVELATITVNLSPTPAAAAAPRPSRHIPGFLAGLRTGVAAFVNTALVAGTGLGFTLPFAVLVAVVGLPASRWARRRRRASALPA